MTMHSASREGLLAAAALALLLVLPSLTDSRVLFDFIIRLAAFGIFATSLNLLVGYGGMVSFGHAMFFGAGAYAFGLLLQKTGIPIPLALLGAVLFCALVALLVGAICVRLKEIYFSFLTLAFQMLFHSIILSWSSLTGGDQGLTGGIPRPVFWGIDLKQPQTLYGFACVMAVICLLLMRMLLQSPFGYTLRMVRDNPERARFLGIDVWRVKLYAFVLAGGFAGVGGVIMALFVSGAYPDFAYWTMSGEAIFMIMMGGLHVFIGPVVGAGLLLVFNDTITRVTELHGLALGIIVLVFALGFKRGVGDFVLQGFRRKPAAGFKKERVTT
ncbi:branched-chain amino acid ABC transporter permease [Bordetella hinzii]|uniref:Branched-chain amino acid ABC transporter permease n=2 Tax=Bordetella hinzii TaxID=103855 RepID=A0AAN1RYE6_9BORD|nr:branched-chain amino acid ABC transporter permease [Bordetella hinzii]AKQ56993.1 leucine/isoleucine/valine transporter permease subunit [Bordetella hinzii]AKQ61459.1 leucine/isoleucine/valine transporter permease subunit [Bordetella hinzii]AZW17572.1 branched-chain amino acid ABC transporter permease [Bordetella hinzii]KCB23846.1 branched-chain amino acid ABC transporter, permease protein [Bordetella hinzii OH87 BAL007II]KCB27487.1 branched-chain amino acid ABC transporter, permease protein